VALFLSQVFADIADETDGRKLALTTFEKFSKLVMNKIGMTSF